MTPIKPIQFLPLLIYIDDELEKPKLLATITSFNHFKDAFDRVESRVNSQSKFGKLIIVNNYAKTADLEIDFATLRQQNKELTAKNSIEQLAMVTLKQAHWEMEQLWKRTEQDRFNARLDGTAQFVERYQSKQQLIDLLTHYAQ